MSLYRDIVFCGKARVQPPVTKLPSSESVSCDVLPLYPRLSAPSPTWRIPAIKSGFHPRISYYIPRKHAQDDRYSLFILGISCHFLFGLVLTSFTTGHEDHKSDVTLDAVGSYLFLGLRHRVTHLIPKLLSGIITVMQVNSDIIGPLKKREYSVCYFAYPLADALLCACISY